MAPPLDLESQLNSEQLPAVTHGEGPQLVLAGAGSGKTRVITFRVAWLVREQGVDPADIVAVTFTNKAAEEMRERVEKLLELYPLPTFVGTFHRYALRLLRRYGERVGVQPGFAIFDRADQLSSGQKGLGRGGPGRRRLRTEKNARRYRSGQESSTRSGSLRSQSSRLLRAEGGPGLSSVSGGSWCRPRVSTSTTCCGWRSRCSPRSRISANGYASAPDTCWWTSFRTPTTPRCDW